MKPLRIVLIICLLFLISGCSALTPKHPTKSKQEYQADKRECEQRAREYVLSQQGMDNSDIDEVRFERNCLKQKGWKYIKK